MILDSDQLFQGTIFKVSLGAIKVSKGAKIRNRYNQVPHLTQDTNKPHVYKAVLFFGKITFVSAIFVDGDLVNISAKLF